MYVLNYITLFQSSVSSYGGESGEYVGEVGEYVVGPVGVGEYAGEDGE